MIEILIFGWVWLCGASFYCGLAYDNTRGFDGAVVSLLALIFWPLLLGCTLRKKLGWSDGG